MKTEDELREWARESVAPGITGTMWTSAQEHLIAGYREGAKDARVKALEELAVAYDRNPLGFGACLEHLLTQARKGL